METRETVKHARNHKTVPETKPHVSKGQGWETPPETMAVGPGSPTGGQDISM